MTHTEWDVRLTYPDQTQDGQGLGFHTEESARQWAAHMIRVSHAESCVLTSREALPTHAQKVDA